MRNIIGAVNFKAKAFMIIECIHMSCTKVIQLKPQLMIKEGINKWEVWKVSAFRYHQKTKPEELKRFENTEWNIDWSIEKRSGRFYFVWNPEVIHHLLSYNSKPKSKIKII